MDPGFLSPQANSNLPERCELLAPGQFVTSKQCNASFEVIGSPLDCPKIGVCCRLGMLNHMLRKVQSLNQIEDHL